MINGLNPTPQADIMVPVEHHDPTGDFYPPELPQSAIPSSADPEYGFCHIQGTACIQTAQGGTFPLQQHLHLHLFPWVYI